MVSPRTRNKAVNGAVGSAPQVGAPERAANSLPVPRILIVSPHRLVLQALRTLLPGEWELAECRAREAEARCDEWPPTVVVLDLSLVRDSASAGRMRQICDRLVRHLAVVALLGPETESPDGELPKGLHGALMVTDALEDWPLAMAAAVRGAAYFSAAAAGHLPASQRDGFSSVEKGLSMRESEILILLREGRAPREIAERLGRSLKTIEGHIQRLKVKLGKGSLAQLRLA